ncbi:MAG: tetratricopeptide repeat protein [Candidatus Melainabacteria bacterium]|nr:tetratricopeptide repeat protein [Candidatus Melainabacteria bacterium]
MLNVNHILKHKVCFSVLLFVFFFLNLFLTSQAESVISELLNLRAENNSILIDVAKKYPEIKFTQLHENKNKILIELLDSKYHDSFHFDIPLKQGLLNGLNFLEDASIGESQNLSEHRKVSILLTLKEGLGFKPKIQSTQNNTVSILFLPIESNVSQNQASIVSDDKNLNSNENNITEEYNKAVGEQLKGNLDQAEKLYKEIISKDTNFYLARYNLSKIYIDKQMYEEAQSVLNSLLKDIGELPKGTVEQKLLSLIHNTSGSICLLNGNYDKALSKFQEVIENDSSFYQAYYNIALVYEKESKLKEAIKNLKKTIELNSAFADAYFHLGSLELLSKDKSDAIANFKKVLELVPGTKVAELSQKELSSLVKK